MSNIKSIAQICIKEPILGSVSGNCVLCGRKTEKGHKIDFSDNFTGFSYLQIGDTICEYCFTFIKNQDFRRKSWIATQEKVIFLNKKEILGYILNPPEPPFSIYITSTGQRQGWLDGYRQGINFSNTTFFILTDFVGLVQARKDLALKMNELISFLRDKKITKEQLLSGLYTTGIYMKAVQEGWEEKLSIARKFAKNQLWEVIVYVHD
jgi:CRISPR type IV-associated protein Csf1